MRSCKPTGSLGGFGVVRPTGIAGKRIWGFSPRRAALRPPIAAIRPGCPYLLAHGSLAERKSRLATAQAPSPESAPPVNRKVVLTVLVSGAFVVILNQTLLNTALPSFMRYFDVTANSAQWLTTIFMLVNGIMIPITAFLIEKFTTRALFLTAMCLFTSGTAVCALAPHFAVLIVGRIIQAAGGGIMIPLMQTILFAIFPLNK